jgi:hypothetical protein
LGFSVGINFSRMAMLPSFHLRVWSQLPGHFGERHYAVAAAHGVSGALAEVLGLNILLIAGTNLLPQRWSFQRWKLRMRIELIL